MKTIKIDINSLSKFLKKSELKNILGGSGGCCYRTHWSDSTAEPCDGPEECEELAGGNYGWWCCNCNDC